MLVRPGDLIDGKYRILREIGGGGMGVVYEAEHVDLGRCAVKLVLPEGLRHADVFERFRREAKAARQLTSKHAVKVYDFGKLPSGIPYLVMELLQGADLDSRLHERGPLPVADLAGYIVEACDALAEAHEAGIVHRDLKPGNLFLARDKKGRSFIKVLDFGIAKVAEPLGGAAGQEMTGEMRLGTLAYMSPEQLRKTSEADARSDIWSLGVILYRLSTGELPFEGEMIWDIADKIFKQTPRPPSARRPGIPAGFDTVVLRCLNKDPGQRFQTAQKLARALAPFVEAPTLPDLSSDDTAPGSEPSTLLIDAPTRVMEPRPSAPGRESLSSVPTSRFAPANLGVAAPPAAAPPSAPVLLSRAVTPALSSGPVPAGFKPPPSPGTGSHPSYGSGPPPRSPSSVLVNARDGVVVSLQGPVLRPSPAFPDAASAGTAPPWSSTGAAANAARWPAWLAIALGLLVGIVLLLVWLLVWQGAPALPDLSSDDAAPGSEPSPLLIDAPTRVMGPTGGGWAGQRRAVHAVR